MGSIRGLSLLWVFTGRSRWRLGFAIFLSAVLAIAEIVAFSALVPLAQILSGVEPSQSKTLRIFADLYGTSDEQDLVAWVCASMVVLFVVKAVCGLAIRWWILGFIYDEEAHLAEELAGYYAGMDLEFHLAHRSTDLLRNLNDSISHVFVFGVIGLVGFLGELTFVVCVGIALLALAPAAMAVFLAYVALSCWGIFAFIRPRARQSGHQMSTSSADMYRLGGDIVRGIREVRLANAAPFMVSKYMATRRSSTDAHRRSGFLSEAPRYLLEIVFVTGLALFAGVLLLTLDPETALPLLAFVVVIGFRLFPTLSRMLSFASLVRIGLPSLEAVKPHLELARAGAADHRDVSSSHPNRLRLEERISIVDVHYRYPGSHDEALKGVSLQLARGSSTALVGRSGSGKSTLADIVSGLLPPTSGSVEVDGLDISLHPHRWNASIGVVSQQPYILDATIRENVAFGLPDDEINDEWLALAVEQAGITELVASLPKGLDSRIGEDGSSISGGQRQRIGLARAFYKQPRFLLLDEATSALDSTTEARITETLAGLRGEVTILIIAHRLSTVQGCDQIAYVDDGRIRHVGSFAEVCAACSDFAEMVRLGTVDGDALV